MWEVLFAGVLTFVGGSLCWGFDIVDNGFKLIQSEISK